MAIVMGKFELPRILLEDEDTATDKYTRFTAEPFERGYGFTLGNALRRTLLSSLDGVAITDVKIEGALHEFTTLDGVYEDVTEIILNLKRVILKMDGREPRKISLSAAGEKEVTAGDIDTGGTVEIVNPDHVIAHLAKGATINIEMGVGIGRGYRPAELNKDAEMSIGVIAIDSIFSPVRKVKYFVEDCRVGQRTDFNRLILEVWTDGRLTPREALIQSAAILNKHLDLFADQELYAVEFEEEIETEDKEDKVQKLLNMPINEIELSVRSNNCIQSANIQTIGDLARLSEAEMLKYRNFGKKSLDEIKGILTSLGLSLGMDIPNSNPLDMLTQGSENSME
jgi:DNA-directed RNA polymerase subunit alpha